VKGLPSASITDDAASIPPQLELCRILPQRIPLLPREAPFTISHRIRTSSGHFRGGLLKFTTETAKPTTRSPETRKVTARPTTLSPSFCLDGPSNPAIIQLKQSGPHRLVA
jgi:hypothetical protein